MSEALNMNAQDRDKLCIIRNALDGRFTQMEAAKMLRLSHRQVQRMCSAVRGRGDRGVLHGLCGQPSNNRLDPELLGRALSALHNPLWHGFGPVFSREKLDEIYGIKLGKTLVRKLMVGTNLWEVHRRGTRHRAWRERRRCVGMLIQLDGSDHDWFEGRGPRCVLVIYIDDATSRILDGAFVNVEDTFTLMRTTKTYLERWGRPVAFYVDKDGIYKVNRQATVEEELRDKEPISQFTRAMGELGVEMIFADSPQAKGRVERGFGTHQDRLVKELRLAGICDIEAANRFLREAYIPKHNRLFAVEPADPIDVHKPLLPAHDLDAILSFRTDRQVQNDFTVRYRNRFFQIGPKQPVRVCRKTLLCVQQRLDGSIHLVSKGHRLKFHEIPGRPYRPACSDRRTTLVGQPKRHRHRRVILNYAALNAARRVPMNPPASALLQA